MLPRPIKPMVRALCCCGGKGKKEDETQRLLYCMLRIISITTSSLLVPREH